jgi:Domain of Unknown Function (DUF1206)
MSVLDAKEVAQNPWVERLGRAGLVAKAAIYGIVGMLALAIPLGLGGKTADRHGALRTVAEQPFGEVLLFALAVGFTGYAIWRFAQAFLDRDDEGKGLKGLAKRISYLARGLLYTASAFVAIALVVGLGSGETNEREETARVLDWPYGTWIVGAVGAGFLIAGGYNLYRSLTGKFRKHLREHEMARAERGWAIVVGVAGHAARAVVFGLIGTFLVKAAVEYDPKEAIGIDGALRKLVQQPYGGALLALVATGLLAYAVYCLAQARYREV